MTQHRTYSLILGIVFCALSSFGANLTFSVTSDKTSYAPGDTVVLCLKTTIAPKHHLYSNPLGPGIGKPLILETGGDTSIHWVAISGTAPKKSVQDEENWVWAYEKEAHFFFTGVVSPTAPWGTENIELIADGLICLTSCVPIHHVIKTTVQIDEGAQETSFAAEPRMAELHKIAQPFPMIATAPLPVAPLSPALSSIAISPPVSESASIPEWNYTSIEQKSKMNLWIALVFALIAGIILNAMPCVLPVLGIKVLSFAKEANIDRRSALLHSLVFAAGMMSVFMILATLAAFAQFSWGQQFQNPFMMLAIICMIFVFSLSMFNVFTIMVPGGVGNNVSGAGNGYAGDFIRGIVTTVLATPCSGPFLGATLAWTLTQPPLVIYVVFFALGTGMASPYILLSISRTAARLIPKPGMWMEDFKRLMGFLLLGFAVYMMIGLPRDLHVVCAGLCVTLALAVVVYTRFAPFGSSVARRIVTALAALVIVAIGLYVNIGIVYNTTSEKAVAQANATGSDYTWEPFNAQALLDANASGQDAVVDFTANWCMNCQYNTVTVFKTKPVMDLLKRKKVRAFLVDMTGPNPAGESLLQHLGSRSIPFFAIFPGSDPQTPIIMRDLVKKSDVMKELEKLADD